MLACYWYVQPVRRWYDEDQGNSTVLATRCCTKPAIRVDARGCAWLRMWLRHWFMHCAKRRKVCGRPCCAQDARAEWARLTLTSNHSCFQPMSEITPSPAVHGAHQACLQQTVLGCGRAKCVIHRRVFPCATVALPLIA